MRSSASAPRRSPCWRGRRATHTRWPVGCGCATPSRTILRQGQRRYPASVAAIGRADLADFVARHVHKKGLVVSAVGDITAAQLSGLLDRVFGGLPSGDQSGDDGAEIAEAHPAMMALSSSAARRCRKAPSALASRAEARRPRLVCRLRPQRHPRRRRFSRALDEGDPRKRGLAYGVSTALVPYRHAGLIFGSIATENSRVAESIALIRAEWQRMREDGPSEAELRDPRRIWPARSRSASTRPGGSPGCSCRCRPTSSASITSTAARR